MEKELNIADILQRKPNTKVWSDTFGELRFDYIFDRKDGLPIVLTGKHGNDIRLTKDGRYYNDVDGVLPCIVPSKQMRDWEKFAWKKGDVLLYTEGEEPYYAIFESFQDDEYTAFKSRYNYSGGNWLQFNSQSSTNHFVKVSDSVAQEVIKIVEEHYGGKLNLKTLEIEKLKPKFKEGDIVVHEESHHIYILKEWDYIMDRIFYYACLDTHSSIGLECTSASQHLEYPVIRLATDSEKQQLLSSLAKIGKKWNPDTKQIEDLPKKCEFKLMDWCLMSDGYDESLWNLCQFAFRDGDCFYHSTGGGIWRECIPYNDSTKHLLGTTDDWKGGEV